jgi:PAS domain S-box-containing protein
MSTDELAELARGLGQVNASIDLVRMLASLVTASHEFIGIADLEGNALFVNEAGRRLVGLRDLDAVHSTRVIDYFAADDQPKIFQEVLPTVRDTGFWQGELNFKNFDTGDLIPVLYNIFPVRDSSGTITAYGTVTRNLTEAKQVEQRIYSLASIVESSDDAIVAKDLNGIIKSWNKGAERIFGFAAGEVIGRPITIVIPLERHDEEQEILARIRNGERIDHFETVRQRKDGGLIDISLTVSPVRNAKGEVIGASKIARDITDQRRTQQQIATLARETEHRSKNVLANVQAIVAVSQSDTPDGLKRAIEGRIRALANVHSLFAENRWLGANLQAIAINELAPYSGANERRVQIYGPPLLLAPELAQAMAMTLHELATNAAKYGALSSPDGQIDLNWSHGRDGRLTLQWREIGGPAVQKPTRQGFGSRIVDRMISQLDGEVRFDWRTDGLVCQITFDTPTSVGDGRRQ